MTLTAEQRNIAIMRVENGWLIRTNSGTGCQETPMQVAETPAKLAELVTAWAAASITKRP